MKRSIIIALMISLMTVGLYAKDYTLTSPNGQLVVTIQVDNGLKWSVVQGGVKALLPSSIDINTSKGVLGDKPVISGVSKQQSFSKAELACNSLTISLKGQYKVEFRAFDNAAAYRILLGNKPVKVNNETSQFCFADDYTAFIPYVNDNRDGERWCYAFESYYDKAPLSKMFSDSLAITPLAVKLPQQKTAVIMEADVENYPGMYFTHSQGNMLCATFPPYPLEDTIGGFNRLNLVPSKRADFIAKNVTKTPWRVLVVADKDAQLMGYNIAEALGPTCKLKDTTWIKPGKVAWDWWNNTNLTGVDFRAGINTDTYKYFIDFAAHNHLEYIIIDEGWSDPEDLLSFSDKMDMEAIISYAKKQGVGVILWSSWRNLVQRGPTKMAEIMSHYQQLGVKGFKVDFFDRDDQAAINSAYEVAACAATHRLLLDLHGLKPFGIQFAYPNIVNFEGVKGLENSKWEPRTATGPLHDQPCYDVTIPYLRMLAGPLDYTPGAMSNATRDQFFGNNDHPMSQGTRVHQMAMYTMYYAPLQMLADSPSKYMKEQECTDFIAQIPTTWDETVGLGGEMGEYAVIARRKGAIWYISAMTDWQARDITIDLSRLNNLGNTANIFADGINADREATDYKHTTLQLSDSNRLLKVHLAPGGGWTAIIK